MREFKDRQGRPWIVSVNVDAVKRVRTLLEIDLLDIGKGKVLEKLASDEVMMVDLVYVLIKPEADAMGVTDEDFGRSMAGDAIDRAYDAFLAEYVDFFRNPRRRELMQKALAKLASLEERIIARAEGRLASGEMEERLETEMRKAEAELEKPPTSGDLSGSTPASSESIPAP